MYVGAALVPYVEKGDLQLSSALKRNGSIFCILQGDFTSDRLVQPLVMGFYTSIFME